MERKEDEQTVVLQEEAGIQDRTGPIRQDLLGRHGAGYEKLSTLVQELGDKVSLSHVRMHISESPLEQRCGG